jgi:hypothetical protein
MDRHEDRAVTDLYEAPSGGHRRDLVLLAAQGEVQPDGVAADCVEREVSSGGSDASIHGSITPSGAGAVQGQRFDPWPLHYCLG